MKCHHTMSTTIWIRQGFQDDYHPFDSLEEAAQYLASGQGCHTLSHYGQYGLSDHRAYKGNNYISAFWGDKDQPQPARSITDKELDDLNRGIMNRRFD